MDKSEAPEPVEKTFKTQDSTITITAKILPDGAVDDSEKIPVNPAREEPHELLLAAPSCCPEGGPSSSPVEYTEYINEEQYGLLLEQKKLDERTISVKPDPQLETVTGFTKANYREGKDMAKKKGSIRFKIAALIIIMSLASFAGLGILVFNSIRMQKI